MSDTNDGSGDYDATPTGDVLRSVVNDKLELKEAFGELIDNAIDANARSIRIEIGEVKRGIVQSIRVEDDGDGCANLIDMVTLGKHTEHKTTLLGRFGIGAKNAMLWLGGLDSSVSIASTRDGKTRRLGIVWKELARSWKIKRECLEEATAEAGDRGTVILLRPCIRRIPEGKALEDRIRDLGYLYSPAIKRGVQIQLRLKRKGSEPIVLQRWELPPLSELVDERIDVNGRGARVYVGVVKEGSPNPRAGITYVHGFRVVKTAGALGCKGMDHSNICGFVELDSNWELTKNKDDISQHREELADAVFASIRGLLERAAQRGQEMLFSELNLQVEKQLNLMLGNPDGKAVRGEGTESGTREPKNTGRKHKRARVEQDGSTFPRRVGKLSVSYCDLGDEKKVGQHSESRVILNSGHAFIAGIRAASNAEALALAALIVFVDGVRAEEDSGQRRLRYQSSGDIVKDVGAILSGAATLDGRPLLSVAAE